MAVVVVIVGRFRDVFKKSLHLSAAFEIPKLDCASMSSTWCKSMPAGEGRETGQTNASIPKINTSLPVDLNWREEKDEF